MSQGIACDGCGAVGACGSVLPVGWLRLLVKARRGDVSQARVIRKLDLCCMKCAPKALKSVIV